MGQNVSEMGANWDRVWRLCQEDLILRTSGGHSWLSHQADPGMVVHRDGRPQEVINNLEITVNSKRL
jgi:hypothetical protein